MSRTGDANKRRRVRERVGWGREPCRINPELRAADFGVAATTRTTQGGATVSVARVSLIDGVAP